MPSDTPRINFNNPYAGQVEKGNMYYSKNILTAKKILIFLILFLPTYLLRSETDNNEASRVRAEHFCFRAMEEYRSGNLGLSEHFIKRCENNSPEYLMSSAGALKLKAILMLRKNDFFNFIETGRKSTALAKDPFLSYRMADAALKTRQIQDAYDFLEDAVSASDSIALENGKNEESYEILYARPVHE